MLGDRLPSLSVATTADRLSAGQQAIVRRRQDESQAQEQTTQCEAIGGPHRFPDSCHPPGACSALGILVISFPHF